MNSKQARSFAEAFPLALTGILFLCSPALAQPKAKPPVGAKIETLQLPAWIERGSVKAGIKAGWAIYAGDRFTVPVMGRPEGTLLTLGRGLSATVRAGQVWGKANTGQALLVLLDGSAEVSGLRGSPVPLNKPQTVVAVPRCG